MTIMIKFSIYMLVHCHYLTSPLNATKISVMKVSHGGVVMFGPELLFLMYKCCFFGVFLR